MKRFECLLIILFLSLTVYQISIQLSLKANDTPRASLNLKSMQSCEMHGGVSCSKGKDKDGSVICADSFAAVQDKYENYCVGSYPIVNVVSISKELSDGSYMVMLRNNSSHKVAGLRLTFSSNPGKMQDLSGLTELSGYEARAFKINADLLADNKKPVLNDFIVNINSNKIIR